MMADIDFAIAKHALYRVPSSKEPARGGVGGCLKNSPVSDEKAAVGDFCFRLVLICISAA